MVGLSHNALGRVFKREPIEINVIFTAFIVEQTVP